ncbi:MAG: pseudouridine synthase [Dehalococcoidia bacterium]
MAVERLQKILSNAGVASRRTSEEMILARRVAVNGVIQATLGARADPEVDEVTVDGVPALRGRYRYFMLNKPTGFVTTARDEQGRATVLDLVPIGDIQLHPVGRLDIDSEGLLILTNDGNLTAMLTHPKHEVEKEYLVALDALPSKVDLARLVRGVVSEGERLRAASVKPASAPPPDAVEEGEAAAPTAWVVVVMKEGRKREVRRMFAALGRTVTQLRRIRVGALRLGTLGSGAFRELSDEEVVALYESVKKLAWSPPQTSPTIPPWPQPRGSAAPSPLTARPRPARRASAKR